jgi:hypothetical protein
VTWLARPIGAATLGLILVVALGLRLWNLDAYTGSFDEGIRSGQLLLMAAGYRPFRDIFASQGPLLLDLLYPPFVWFGQTLAAVRSGVVIFSMVGLVGAWWVGRVVAGPIGGLAAAALLALSPAYLEGSRLALAEVPTIAPALLALAALYQWGRARACSGCCGGDVDREARSGAAWRAGGRAWLVGSAVLCSLALLIKPMVIHLAVPIVAALLLFGLRNGGRCGGRTGPLGALRVGRRELADLVLYGAIVIAASALVVGALGPAEVWDNLGAYRSGAGDRPGADWAENVRLTRNVMGREGVGLFALAAVGLLLGLRRRPLMVAPVALWVAAILSLFLLYGDLADKHIVYLVPPLALLGAVGVGLAGERGIRLARLAMTERAGLTWRGAAPALIGLAAVGVYLSTVPALCRSNLFIVVDAEGVAVRRRDEAAEREMSELMLAVAGPDEWVLSDNPNAAFRARRLLIPSLVDTSGTRVDAGSLTSPKVMDAVQRYRPAVIVTWPRRLGRLDEFTRWLPEAGYRLDREYESGWKLYVRGAG